MDDIRRILFSLMLLLVLALLAFVLFAPGHVSPDASAIKHP